jgi:hypothetical protein
MLSVLAEDEVSWLRARCLGPGGRGPVCKDLLDLLDLFNSRPFVLTQYSDTVLNRASCLLTAVRFMVLNRLSSVGSLPAAPTKQMVSFRVALRRPRANK